MINNEQSCATHKPILIFPSGMPGSLEFLQKCIREGQSVIGASSLDYDISKQQYSDWVSLPFVTTPEFSNALKQTIVKYNVGGIYSSNPVVWDYLNRNLNQIAPEVNLVNESPINTELSGYFTALKHAQKLLEKSLNLATNIEAKASISKIELAALFKHASLIPGMCDHEKFCALHEISKNSTSGDIVEIGSWWGKSAFILARLARLYEIGNLLCVDPWENELLVSKDADLMVSRAFSEVDAGEALLVFEMNLIPYNAQHINYLRMRSIDGAKIYRKQHSVTTTSFGTTHYCGRIAILHIDGNHSYDAVKIDIESWGEFVVAGGWIIFDDYIWPYGNGPQLVGDEFLLKYFNYIEVVFVMGSALCIQLSSPLPRL